MFCKRKGHELNTFILSIFWGILWNPWVPLECVCIDLKKKCVWLCAGLIWCIYAKRHSSHFECIKKHKITPRSCCLRGHSTTTWTEFCLLVSNTFPECPTLWEQNCLLLVKIFLQSKQFCSPREGNPGNMLLTSWNRQNYFYQCGTV